MASPFSEVVISGKERGFFKAFAFDAFAVRKEASAPQDIDRRALMKGNDSFASIVAPPWTFPVPAIDSDRTMNGLTAELFEKIAPATKSAIAADCGHFIQEEQPQFLVKSLLDFLALRRNSMKITVHRFASAGVSRNDAFEHPIIEPRVQRPEK